MMKKILVTHSEVQKKKQSRLRTSVERGDINWCNSKKVFTTVTQGMVGAYSLQSKRRLSEEGKP